MRVQFASAVDTSSALLRGISFIRISSTWARAMPSGPNIDFLAGFKSNTLSSSLTVARVIFASIFIFPQMPAAVLTPLPTSCLQFCELWLDVP